MSINFIYCNLLAMLRQFISAEINIGMDIIEIDDGQHAHITYK